MVIRICDLCKKKGKLIEHYKLDLHLKCFYKIYNKKVKWPVRESKNG